MENNPAQDENIALLNEVYLNCKMGAAAIDTLLPKIDDSELAKELQATLIQHQNIANQAATELRNRSVIPSENNPFGRVGLWSSIQFHMLTKRTRDHIAEMMIQGDTMGIINLTKALKACSTVDDQIAELAKTVIAQEQDSIERMKKYL